MIYDINDELGIYALSQLETETNNSEEVVDWIFRSPDVWPRFSVSLSNQRVLLVATQNQEITSSSSSILSLFPVEPGEDGGVSKTANIRFDLHLT